MANHLFSFENSYGEKMYAIVVGAKSEDAAADIVPSKFDKYEGTVNGIPKAAYDADVFYANESHSKASQLIKLVEAISGIWDKGHSKKPRINSKGTPLSWYWLQTFTKDDDADGGDFGGVGDGGDGGGE